MSGQSVGFGGRGVVKYAYYKNENIFRGIRNKRKAIKSNALKMEIRRRKALQEAQDEHDLMFGEED